MKGLVDEGGRHSGKSNGQAGRHTLKFQLRLDCWKYPRREPTSG